MNFNEKLKLARKNAKEAGLVCKRQKGYINGKPVFMLTDRVSGRTVLENCFLDSILNSNLKLED